MNFAARRDAISAIVQRTTRATKYQVKLSTETGWVDGRDRLITGLQPDTLYTIEGRAGNAGGWGPSISRTFRTLA